MSDLRKETEMTNHQYGPKGHIVDAFLEHLEGMTKADWLAVSAASNAVGWTARDAAKHAVWDAAQDTIGYALGYAARNAAGYASGYAAKHAGWDATWHAVWEIQGADLLRERGQPFFFLPMFGFADERAIIKQGST